MTYMVKEIFRTLQGEGYHAGTPAVFVRMTGCNLWSGHDGTREYDAAKNDAKCPLWCDTDFVGGDRMTAAEIANAIMLAALQYPIVVFTGGEPLLQVDAPLLATVAAAGYLCCIETNGTQPVPFTTTTDSRPFITVSPKTPVDQLDSTTLRRADEIKVIWPEYDPRRFDSLVAPHCRKFVQPLADGDTLIPEHASTAAEFCLAHPTWRLSVQGHKLAGIP